MTDSSTTTATFAENLAGKVVVTDTSSLILAGTSLLQSLSSCHLVIPAVVVQELEDKRGHATIGFHAREWIRLLEEARVKYGFELSKSIKLEGYDDITLSVEPNHSNQSSLPKHLQNGSHDSTILAVARNLQLEKAEANTGEHVVILTNDMPMRLHATLDLKMDAYEFNATQILNAKPFSGVYTVELDPEEYAIVSSPLSVGGKVTSKIAITLIENKLPEERAASYRVDVVLPSSEVVAQLVAINGVYFQAPHKNKALGITGKNLEQDVALEYLRVSADEVPIVSVGGGAGTGKTLLTVATALDELKSNRYEKVVVFRSLHEMGNGQEMGFLPGDVDEKMEAWAGAVLDALDVLARVKKPLPKNATAANVEAQKKEAKRLRDMIEVQPITYLRGRSLASTYIILDEAQNFSRSELLNIISRAGAGSKIVLLWDAAQVDNKYLSSGKNADIWSVVNDLKTSDLFAHTSLTKTERSRVAELASALLEKG